MLPQVRKGWTRLDPSCFCSVASLMELIHISAEDTLMDLEEHEDFTAGDTHPSVLSSEWGNVSSTGSISSGDNQLSAKDVANCRQSWDVWANHHRLFTATTETLSLDGPLPQYIHDVFQFAYHIPRSWFDVNFTAQSAISDKLRFFFVEIAQASPDFLGENTSALPAHLESDRSLVLAATALQIHDAVRRLAHDTFSAPSDEQWALEIHDPLIVQCARGCIIDAPEAWPLPNKPTSYLDPSPTTASILNVRKIQPRGAIPIPFRDEVSCREQAVSPHGSAFAAAFATRLQITAPLRDVPESLALHSFNTMATSAILGQFRTLGIDMPVFGALFDRNVVRIHVDWSMPNRNDGYADHASLPLPSAHHPFSTPPSFKDFDLTRPDDALRVVFILDAIHAFAETRLTPAVRSRLWDLPRIHSKLPPLSQDEISSAEKVQAWMQNGALDAVGYSDS